jgi:predicted RNA-binding Zn-ribbon protein involved in translation (DUF1610 family)
VSQRRSRISQFTSCGATVVAYEPGEQCPDCGEVIVDG